MSSRDPIPMTRQRLSGARLELALAQVVRRAATALWQWLAVAAIIIGIDVLWPLPVPARLLLGLVLLVGVVRLVWRCVPPRALRLASADRLAREIERRCDLRHNPLINAVQLQVAPVHGAAPDIKALLLDRSAQRGEAAARATEPARLVEPRARNRSRLALLGAIVFGLGAVLIAPRPIGAVTLRLIDPWGDHPPYTPLTFHIITEPTASQLVYGDSARVDVRIDGGSVPHADLVWRARDVRGAQPQRLPMKVAGASSGEGAAPHYSMVLRDCRESMQFMIDTPRGRSRWFDLDPRLEPRWVSRVLAITGPSYAAAQGERRVPLSDRVEPLRVLQGSRLVMHATSTLQLRTMTATIASDAVTIAPDGLEAQWNWPAATPGRHEIDLALVGPSGLRSTPTHLEVEVVADSPPVVSIERPPPRAAALPDQQFTARLTAADDVSLADITLTTQIERGGEIIEEHEEHLGPASDAPVARAGAHIDVDLMAYDVQPGDIVRMQARAADRRGEEFGGPQITESNPADILIIDEQTYAAMCEDGRGGGGQRQPGQGEGECEGEGEGQGQGIGQGRGQGQGSGQGTASVAGAGPASGFSMGGEGRAGGASGEGAEPAGSAPGSGESPGGSRETQAGAGPSSEQLLAQAQAESRSLIERQEPSQPIAGESDPDAPRRHLDALDESGASPLPAESRATQRATTGAATDPAGPQGAVPARYRDLVARYFKRLAEAEASAAERSRSPNE